MLSRMVHCVSCITLGRAEPQCSPLYLMAYVFASMKVGPPEKVLYLFIVVLKFRIEEGTEGDCRDAGRKEGKEVPKVMASCSQKTLWGEIAGRHGDGHLNRTR